MLAKPLRSRPSIRKADNTSLPFPPFCDSLLFYMPHPIAREFCRHDIIDPIDLQNPGINESFRWAYVTGDCYRCLVSARKKPSRKPVNRRIPIRVDQASTYLAWLALRQIGHAHLIRWLNPFQRREAIGNACFLNILRRTPTLIAQPEWLNHPVWRIDPLIVEERDANPENNRYNIYHYRPNRRHTDSDDE